MTDVNNDCYLYRYDTTRRQWRFVVIRDDTESALETWYLSNGIKVTIHNKVYRKEQVMKLEKGEGEAIFIFYVLKDDGYIGHASRRSDQTDEGLQLVYGLYSPGQGGASSCTIKNPLCSWEEIRAEMSRICNISINLAVSHTGESLYKHTV